MVRTIDASKIKKIKYRPYPINITCNGCGKRTRIDVDQKCDKYCIICLMKMSKGEIAIPKD